MLSVNEEVIEGPFTRPALRMAEAQTHFLRQTKGGDVGEVTPCLLLIGPDHRAFESGVELVGEDEVACIGIDTTEEGILLAIADDGVFSCERLSELLRGLFVDIAIHPLQIAIDLRLPSVGVVCQRGDPLVSTLGAKGAIAIDEDGRAVLAP